MKVLNKDVFFQLLFKFNILLIFSAALLTVFLYKSINRTYDFFNGQSNNKRGWPLELMAYNAASETVPLFQEDIFKKKHLFNQEVTKKPELEKRVFTLLGVSMGEKNIAVIRDTRANKDYYCSKGDMIGDFKVKEILMDKVVLESVSGILEISR